MEMKSIPMEAETIPTLITGFIITILVVTVILILLLIKRKDLVYGWFIGQVVFLCISFIFVIKVLGKDQAIHSMVSENISLSVGLSALLWTISMIFMVTGILKLSKRNAPRTIKVTPIFNRKFDNKN